MSVAVCPLAVPALAENSLLVFRFTGCL